MAIHGHKCVLNWDSTGGSTYALIAEILRFNSLGISAEMVETKSLDTANYFKTFIPGWADAGEVTFECLWVPSLSSQQSVLVDNLIAGLTNGTATAASFQVQYCDSGTTTDIVFTGFVQSVTINIDLEQLIQATVVIKVTGKPTIP